VLEKWNDGMLSIKNGKHITKSAAGGRSSNLYHGDTYPWTHHSIIPMFELDENP
jgi:hypothetical protein